MQVLILVNTHKLCMLCVTLISLISCMKEVKSAKQCCAVFVNNANVQISLPQRMSNTKGRKIVDIKLIILF